jgi:hypothetical protein
LPKSVVFLVFSGLGVNVRAKLFLGSIFLSIKGGEMPAGIFKDTPNEAIVGLSSRSGLLSLLDFLLSCEKFVVFLTLALSSVCFLTTLFYIYSRVFKSTVGVAFSCN